MSSFGARCTLAAFLFVRKRHFQQPPKKGEITFAKSSKKEQKAPVVVLGEFLWLKQGERRGRRKGGKE